MYGWVIHGVLVFHLAVSVFRGLVMPHTLFVESRAWSFRCCGLSSVVYHVWEGKCSEIIATWEKKDMMMMQHVLVDVGVEGLEVTNYSHRKRLRMFITNILK